MDFPASESYLAAGNVPPMTPVKLSASGKVVVSTMGDRSIGISQQATRRAGWIGALAALDDGYAAISGENVMVYVDGAKDVAAVVGTGVTIAYGDRCKMGTAGLMSTATDKDQYIARAREGGTPGQIIRVDVEIGEVSV